jgi:hypothetical protein
LAWWLRRLWGEQTALDTPAGDRMMAEFFYRTNLWSVGTATLLLFLCVSEGGYQLGRFRAKPRESKEGEVGPALGGLIGMLGLLLAFTFGMASARFDLRKQLLVEQANAIGTAYLRTDLLPDARRTEARALLRDYVGAQLDAVNAGRTADALARGQGVLDKLWSLATATALERPTPVSALFVQAINDVIDAQGKRVALGWQNPLPLSIIATLYLVSLLVLAVMGFEGGMAGKRRPVVTLVLGVTLAVVVLMILDLDRPQEGFLRNSQRPMLELREQFAKPVP